MVSSFLIMHIVEKGKRKRTGLFLQPPPFGINFCIVLGETYVNFAGFLCVNITDFVPISPRTSATLRNYFMLFSANVTVQTDPYVWYNSNAQFPLELRCFVRGYPYADVSWRYRGLLIRGSDVGNNVTLTTKPLDHVTMISTLTIREPGFKSFNMTRFTCAGVNKYGMDRQTTAVVNTGKDPNVHCIPLDPLIFT